MNPGIARRVRFIIQRDLITAVDASQKELHTRSQTYGLGLGYDYQYIANECTIAVANLLLEEERCYYKKSK